MQLRKLGAAWLAVSSILIWSGIATASGFGFFLEYGRNIAAPGGDLVFNLLQQAGAADRNEFSIGIATDTNLAADRLFNYRFDLGYHRSSWVNGNVNGLFGASNGVSLNNAFGFGILRTPGLRVWLGPAVRLNFDYYGDADAFDIQVGVGPQLGVNFNPGEKVSVVLSGAYNYKWGWAIDTSSFGALGTQAHRDHYVSVNLAFMFRGSGDQY